MKTEGRLLKVIRICGVLQVIAFGLSLLCVPAWSSAMGDRIRSSPPDDLYIVASQSFSGFAWLFGGTQAFLAGIVLLCSSIAIRRSTSGNKAVQS
ncbi:MAG: hypothetical protein AB7G28_08015 [Pirellulales bacterium]